MKIKISVIIFLIFVVIAAVVFFNFSREEEQEFSGLFVRCEFGNLHQAQEKNFACG